MFGASIGFARTTAALSRMSQPTAIDGLELRRNESCAIGRWDSSFVTFTKIR